MIGLLRVSPGQNAKSYIMLSHIVSGSSSARMTILRPKVSKCLNELEDANERGE